MTIILNIAPTILATWEDLRQHVMLHVNGAPIFEVDRQLRLSAREFLTNSRLWREENYFLGTTAPGVSTYTIALPENGELAAICAAWVDGQEANVMLPGEQNTIPPGETSADCLIGARGPEQVFVAPAPNRSATMLGTVAWTVNMRATGVPRWIADEYGEAIGCGAVARLQLMPNRTWSSPQLAGVHMERFRSEVDEASNRAGPVSSRPLRVKSW